MGQTRNGDAMEQVLASLKEMKEILVTTLENLGARTSTLEQETATHEQYSSTIEQYSTITSSIKPLSCTIHPPPSKSDISFAGTFASSAFAASFAKICTIPLNTAKVGFQQPQKKALSGDVSSLPKYRCLLGTVSTIAREEGASALWKGIVPGLHRQCFFGGLRIGLYEPVKNLYVSDDFFGDVLLIKKVLAALTTGALAITVANPTDLVKVRLQAEGKLPPGVPRHYSGALNVYSTIVRRERDIVDFLCRRPQPPPKPPPKPHGKSSTNQIESSRNGGENSLMFQTGLGNFLAVKLPSIAKALSLICKDNNVDTETTLPASIDYAGKMFGIDDERGFSRPLFQTGARIAVNISSAGLVRARTLLGSEQNDASLIFNGHKPTAMPSAIKQSSRWSNSYPFEMKEDVKVLVLRHLLSSCTAGERSLSLAFEVFEKTGDYGFRVMVLSCKRLLSCLAKEKKSGNVEFMYKEMIESQAGQWNVQIAS